MNLNHNTLINISLNRVIRPMKGTYLEATWQCDFGDETDE